MSGQQKHVANAQTKTLVKVCLPHARLSETELADY